MLKMLTVIMLSTILLGCGLNPDKPIRKQEFRNSEQPKKHLVILLSGRGADFDYFEANKWADIANKYTQDYDFIAPFAHYGYYMTRELIPRLHEDIIVPARQQGYQTISLVGISMGGLGTLLYSRKYPELVDRIYLFAPFLGKDEVHAQIRAAGGLAQWQISAQDRDDWNYYIWLHLKNITGDPVRKHKLFLGYGDKDRLNGHDLLAQSIPPKNLVTLQGNHDDVTFVRLWEAMLAQGLLERPTLEHFTER